MPHRLWYETGEIDAIMEAELHKAGEPALACAVAVDIDAFVEQHLGIVPVFVNLPAGVQGATDFTSDGLVRMKIAADLAERANEESTAERLLRTTIAHEAAHVILHRALFLRQTETLFDDVSTRQNLCRDIRFVGRGYTGEWWEWQANQGMSALLLPRSRLIGEVQRYRARFRHENSAQGLEQELAHAFVISRTAIRYRLEQLGVAGDPRQERLNLS
jgi:hypothetical protein